MLKFEISYFIFVSKEFEGFKDIFREDIEVQLFKFM